MRDCTWEAGSSSGPEAGGVTVLCDGPVSQSCVDPAEGRCPHQDAPSQQTSELDSKINRDRVFFLFKQETRGVNIQLNKREKLFKMT